jgi:hypothetical protein
MEKLNDREIKLDREQYDRLSSNINIMKDMYEMKVGHELRMVGKDFILKFVDDKSLDIFIGYIYNQYMREA